MRYIDEDEIYRSTDGGKTIFQHYYSTYEYGVRGKYIKLRSEEKTASAQITLYQGYWRVTDFGNQSEISSMKAIPFVMWIENLTYYEALKYIEEVILNRTVESSNWRRPQWRADYECRELASGDVKGEYRFTYKSREEITSKDLEAIGRYITVELLEEYDCRVVKYYEYCAYSKTKKRDVVHVFKATEDYPIFVFDYGDFKKLYRPHEMDKKLRFSYVGNKPKDYIYGLKQIRRAQADFDPDEDEDGASSSKEKPKARFKDIFRCSGESDSLNLASLGCHVYWLNSESAELAYDDYKEIDEMCINHYQIMDLDATGQKMAAKNALKYINISTVVLPDWLSQKKDFRGNPCKDLKDFINIVGSHPEDTKQQFSYLKVKARKVKFWMRDPDKGTYNLNLEYLFFFLNMNGFYQIDYRRLTKANYCYVHVKDKVVDLISPEDFKRKVKFFLKDWICKKNLPEEINLLNKLNSSNQISEGTLDTLRKTIVNLTTYDKDNEYMHFRNASMRITKDNVELVKRDSINNYILGSAVIKDRDISHIISRDISKPSTPAISVDATPDFQLLLDELITAKTIEERDAVNTKISMFPDIERYTVTINDKDFIFTSFVRDLSRLYWRKEMERGEELTDAERKEQNLTTANIMFCIGYLCAQYKHPAKPWIVLFQDSKESEVGQSSGRSGKSLLSSAIKYVRQQFYVDGRILDKPDNFKFVYDGLTEFHDVVEVDDFAEYGDFDYFYTQATGSRTVNCKHTSPFTLDFKESGKLFISTNFELPNTNSSTLARILPCGVSDYYHQKTDYNDYKETRSPDKKYGKQLYNDFTEEEWQKFYHFIAYCIQLQMRFEKITPPTRLLEKRQLRREMSAGLGRDEAFLLWAEDYFKVWDGDSSIMRPRDSDTDTGYVYLDTYFQRKAAFENFIEHSGISGNKKQQYSAQRFKKHLKTWARYKGFELNPDDVCTDIPNNRIMRNEGKLVEYFYIRSSQSISSQEDNEDTELDNQLAF